MLSDDSTNNNELTQELNESYKPFLRTDMDVLDVGLEGQAAWASARHLYEMRLERSEERITRLLEERLGNAKTAEEMFRVFAVFNPLFFRPAIRNAVNSFRTALVKNVREDVKRLQEKFQLRYDESLERATADIRDIPPLSGRIIWARQIENQLSTLMKRMVDVLGAGWEDHFDGKQLKEVCDELRNYLDTDQRIKDWLMQQVKTDYDSRYNELSKFLLLVEEDVQTHKKYLRVNFDPKQIVLFKEVRYLEWLLPNNKITIPSTVKSLSKVAYTRYPVAMALQAALSSVAQAKKGLTPENTILLVSYIQAFREMVKEAIGGSARTRRWIRWDAVDLNEWVGQFASKIYALQERVDDVTEKMALVNDLLRQLRSCRYDYQSMLNIMSSLQGIVDDMQMRGLSNVNVWVSNLDIKIEDILSIRLRSAIRSWTNAFIGETSRRSLNEDIEASTVSEEVKVTDAIEVEAVAEGVESSNELLDVGQTVHEILQVNQILHLSPPLEQARAAWISSFHQYLSITCSLPRIVSSRYQVFADTIDGPKDYLTILSNIENDLLRLPYQVIESKLDEAKIYVQRWLQYQALWDVSVAVIAERVGRDIRKWQQLLLEIKTSRSTIESADEERAFGPIVINYRQVQNKVNMKYDTWQRECQQRFGAILLEEMKGTHSELLNIKHQLEGVHLDGPTKDVIVGVEYILKMKSIIAVKMQLALELESSEKLLTKQRYQFPRDWLSASNVTGIMGDLQQLLDRKVSIMDAQLPALQIKIRDEYTQLCTRVEELLSKWQAERPVDGHLSPLIALQTIGMYNSQVTKLSEEVNRINGAKEALGMDFLAEKPLGFIADELVDLRDVWTAVSPAWDKLQSMRAQPFKDLNPTKIRKQLEEVSDDLRMLPSKVRTYAPYETLIDTIAKNTSAQPLLRDMCTDALKDRHWKQLLKSMGLTVSFADLSLGNIWDSNILSHKKTIAEILSTAQGELALEQFLRDLREYWVGCELSLVARAGGIRLITGWDVVFTMLEDHLNSLASLKQSPYYRNVQEFQEDTVNWEGRLTTLRGIFDVWVEVQRKWVYLSGIFKNPDIKAQLPSQFSKFKSVDNEFLSLMKRVSAKPNALDLLQVENLGRQLERQDATMSLIQKALGDYLEKQRQIFPRFYFVNNDDLVEIIGNSNEPSRIVTHLSKMFAALNSISIDSENTMSASGESAVLKAKQMFSKEGEVVALKSPLNMMAGVKDWLGSLEQEMVVTLASLLQEAVTSMPKEESGLLKWISTYPAQVSLKFIIRII